MTQVKAGGGGGDRNSEILVLCPEGVQTQHLAPVWISVIYGLHTLPGGLAAAAYLCCRKFGDLCSILYANLQGRTPNKCNSRTKHPG